MHETVGAYFQYLEAHKSGLPPQVYAFASDEERHNLSSPHSLHDAWLTSLTITEDRADQRPFDPRTTIELVLLGPMHDRDIVLTYEGVDSYRVEGQHLKPGDTLHGDVDRHEARVSDDDLVVHEIAFVSTSRIVIMCETFTCTEREYS